MYVQHKGHVDEVDVVDIQYRICLSPLPHTRQRPTEAPHVHVGWGTENVRVRIYTYTPIHGTHACTVVQMLCCTTTRDRYHFSAFTHTVSQHQLAMPWWVIFEEMHTYTRVPLVTFPISRLPKRPSYLGE